MTLIVDGFAGPGGVSEGLRLLGVDDIGVEWDAAACATRAAAGHRTIRADVTRMPVDHLRDVEGVVMTPPCQTFSSAGKGDGRAELARLTAAIDRGDWTARSAGSEVLEVGRWVETLRPRWVMCEQVPPVLPLWQAYAARWRALYGWSCWAGTLLAADYGVPQTRLRAFLLARTDGQPARPPEPTHCKGGASTLLGELAPWVSMADALGWPGEWAVQLHRGAGMIERHGDRPVRPATEPAPTIRAGTKGSGPNLLVLKAGAQENAAVRSIDEPSPTVLASWDNGDTRWQLNRRQQHEGTPVRNVPVDEPAPTLTGIAGAKSQWVWERPAATVCGDPRLSFPGHHDADHRGMSADDGSVKLTLAQALVLQGFPPDYPVQGNKTQQFTQVGNAVPPPLAAHVIASLTGRTLEAAA